MNQAVTAVPQTVFMSTVAMHDEGPFKTFKDAFMNFMGRIKAEPLPTQLLETACWIERISNGVKSPLLFYDVRDFGYKTGLFVGRGALNTEAPEPDPVLVADLYQAAFATGGDAEGFIDAIKPFPLPEFATTAESETTVTGIVSGNFEHHVTVTLPDGRMFQVHRSAVKDNGETFVLQDDAEIEHYFGRRESMMQPTISVPASVLARLPA